MIKTVSLNPTSADEALSPKRSISLPDGTQPQSPEQLQRFEGLDGLRGLAAVVVLLNHMALNGLFLAPQLDLIGLGKPAVYLFFQLSAFLLASQAWVWPQSKVLSPTPWLGYLVARVFRIWPLFLAYVGTAMVTTRFGGSLLDGAGLPETITPTDAFRILTLQRWPGSVLWTIPVEFKFYLLLPIIVIGLALLVKRATVTSLVIVGVAAAACFAFIPTASVGASPVPFLSIFLTGVFGAILHHRLQQNPTRIPRRFFEGLAWFAVVLLAAVTPSIARQITGLPIPGAYLEKAHLLSSAIGLMLILGMLNGEGAMRRVLNSKPLIQLGALSYGVYLCHMTVLQIIVWPRLPLPMAARAWLGFVGAIALALFTYWVIEAPALRIGARVRRALTRRQGPAAIPRCIEGG